MPRLPQTEGGRRLRGLEHVKRLAFVLPSRDLGFPSHGSGHCPGWSIPGGTPTPESEPRPRPRRHRIADASRPDRPGI